MSLGSKKWLKARIACDCRDLEEVRELIKSDPVGILFSCTLMQLNVADRALSTIDPGRIGYIIDTCVMKILLDDGAREKALESLRELASELYANK